MRIRLVASARFQELAMRLAGAKIKRIRSRGLAVITGAIQLSPADFASSRISFTECGYALVVFRSGMREWVLDVDTETTPPPRRPRRLGDAAQRVAAIPERSRRPRVQRQKRGLLDLCVLALGVLGPTITRFLSETTGMSTSSLATQVLRWRARLAHGAKHCPASPPGPSSIIALFGQVFEPPIRPCTPINAPTLLWGENTSLSRLLGAYRAAPKPNDNLWDVSLFGERFEESELLV